MVYNPPGLISLCSVAKCLWMTRRVCWSEISFGFCDIWSFRKSRCQIHTRQINTRNGGGNFSTKLEVSMTLLSRLMDPNRRQTYVQMQWSVIYPASPVKTGYLIIVSLHIYCRVWKVKEFRKSVDICRSYGQDSSVMLFDSRGRSQVLIINSQMHDCFHQFNSFPPA